MQWGCAMNGKKVPFYGSNEKYRCFEMQIACSSKIHSWKSLVFEQKQEFIVATCRKKHLLVHDWMIDSFSSPNFMQLSFCCNKNLNVLRCTEPTTSVGFDFSCVWEFTFTRIQLDHYTTTTWVLPGKPIQCFIHKLSMKTKSRNWTKVKNTPNWGLHNVDGRNPANQLRLVLYPIIYHGFWHPN